MTNKRTASMIRVDQAGEYGATRIYAGQLAVMGDRHPMAREIAHMAEQEERHRKFFDDMIAKRGVRPTALQPVWKVAGFALGAVTAAMGPRAVRVAAELADGWMPAWVPRDRFASWIPELKALRAAAG